MIYSEAIQIAQRAHDLLAPRCYRLAIAGSLRRKAPEVGDIEIVAIPKPYDVGLFSTGIAEIVNQWKKVKGELPCRYTQRMLPEGIKLDLFFATPKNWGYIYAIRTGSDDFSKRLADGWVRNGYHGKDGMLVDRAGNQIPCWEETDLFRMAGIKWLPPESRI